MKVAPALAALVLMVVPTAAARDYPRPGPVRAIGTSGYSIVYAMAVRGGCFEVRVWSSRGTDMRMGRNCFETTSTGSGIPAVAYARGRALWLSYTGGNIREWSLWTKGGSAPARRIAFEPVPVDDPAPIVVAESSEWALAYAAGSRIVAFDGRGRRLFTHDAGDRVTALSTQQYGVAAVLAGGKTLGLSYDGKLVAERAYAAGEPQVAELTAKGLLVRTRTALDLGNRSFAVPRNARWHGFAGGRFAYSVGNALYVGRVSDGKHALVRRYRERFVAQIGRITLAVAHGRTLSREPAVDVASRLFD